MQKCLLFLWMVLVCTTGFAAESSSVGNSFGLNVGLGFPFLGQIGANYEISDTLRVGATFNILDIKVDDAKARLTMPEIFLTYHPFAGSFFIGGGVGREKLTVTATEEFGSNEVRAEVTATTAVAKLGWMWGTGNGGFWFGTDISYIKPMRPKNSLSAPGVPTTDPNYQDVVEAMDDFGDTAYFNLTFARLGYFF